MARFAMIISLTMSFTGVVFCLSKDGISESEVPSLLLFMMALLICERMKFESPRLSYVNLLTTMSAMLVRAPWLELSIGGVIRIKWILLLLSFSWVIRVVARTGWRSGLGVLGVILSPLLGVIAHVTEWSGTVALCALLIIFFGAMSIIDSRFEILAPLAALAYAFSAPILNYSQLTQQGFNVLCITAGAIVCIGTKARDKDNEKEKYKSR